jgi:hypothetical protein
VEEANASRRTAMSIGDLIAALRGQACGGNDLFNYKSLRELRERYTHLVDKGIQFNRTASRDLHWWYADYYFGDDAMKKLVLYILPFPVGEDRLKPEEEQSSLLQASIALEISSTRRGFVTLLDDFVTQVDTCVCHQMPGLDRGVFSSSSQTRGRNVVQLTLERFEMLCQLCSSALYHCLEQKDYITAYSLVNIIANYFCVLNILQKRRSAQCSRYVWVTV